MKNFLTTLILAAPIAGFTQGNTYIVQGDFPAEKAHLTLQYNKGNNTHIRQETDVINGKFKFQGTIDAPYKVYLMASYPNATTKDYDDHLEFFLDMGTTTIHTRDSLKNATVAGTQAATEGLVYDKPMTELLARLTADYETREKAASEEEKKTEAFQKAMEAIDDSFLVQQKRMNITYLKTHPDSRLCLYIFREQTYGIEYAELAPLWEGVSEKIRNSAAGRQYAQRLARLKMVALGQTAPDFQHPDSSGKMIELSSFRGKYVLIDFWASWCGPCRGESPYLVAAHDKYKDRGFTIIGISLDKKAQRRQWLQAIEHDKLYWTQLSDLSDSNPIVQLYGVKGIPQNFLLDPQGKIIAHNLRGAMLDKMLDSIMKKKFMSFSVKGRIGHYSAPYKAYLSYVAPNGLTTDSATITDGSFSFAGWVKSPRKAYLKIGASDYKTFFLEKEEVSIASPDSIGHATITGHKVNQDYTAFTALLQQTTDSIDEIQKSFANVPVAERKTPAFRQKIEERMRPLRERLFSLEMQFMKDHPDSWVSLMTMLDDYYSGRDLAPYKPIFDAFTPELKASSTGVFLTPEIESAQTTAIGSQAIDFTIPDATGTKHSLKDFRGKYVLVDFWASWCLPCRAENPNVLKAYNAFKAKGFTVVGVSIDDAKDKDKWIAAIKKDGMPWTQLSELQGWQAPVAQSYGIRAIPQNFLLDPSGHIVAKGLRGEDLTAKLAELLNK